jgi:hypothetical protein
MARIDSASCLGGGAHVLRSSGQRAVHSGAICANNADTNVNAHDNANAHAAAGVAAAR